MSTWLAAAWQRQRNLVQRQQYSTADTRNHRLRVAQWSRFTPCDRHSSLSTLRPRPAVPDSNACGSPASASRFVVTYVKTIVYIRCYSEVHVTDLSEIVRSGEHLPEYLLYFYCASLYIKLVSKSKHGLCFVYRILSRISINYGVH